MYKLLTAFFVLLITINPFAYSSEKIKPLLISQLQEGYLFPCQYDVKRTQKRNQKHIQYTSQLVSCYLYNMT